MGVVVFLVLWQGNSLWSGEYPSDLKEKPSRSEEESATIQEPVKDP